MFKGARGAGAADAGPDGQLAELFARLQTAVDDQAHKKALKISESILEASPGDADATRCKVVALLELARYADAVSCVSAAEDSLRADLAFEHAYALYKSHHLSDALALLEATSGGDDGPSFAATQLKAQLLYRVGRARESAEIYERLFAVRLDVRAIANREPIDPSTRHIRGSVDGRSPDVLASPPAGASLPPSRAHPPLLRFPHQLDARPARHPARSTLTPPFRSLAAQDHPSEVAELPSMPTNLAASFVASGRAAELPAALNRFGVSPTASFELIFNVACGLIELGDVSAAADRLLLAERVGNETLVDEDLGEDEIADELLPVRTQKARVAALRGDVTTALEGYRAALATRSSDAAAHAVAANNLAALVGPRGEGGAEAVRRVERACGQDGAPAEALRGAFAAAPATIAAMATNRAVALLHTNHLDRCRDALPAASTRRQRRRVVDRGGASRARTKTRSRRGDVGTVGTPIDAGYGRAPRRVFGARADRRRRGKSRRRGGRVDGGRRRAFREIARARGDARRVTRTRGGRRRRGRRPRRYRIREKRARGGGDSRGGPRVIPRARGGGGGGVRGGARESRRGGRRGIARRARARASPPRWSPRATSTPPNETRRFFSRRSSRRAGVRFRTRTRSRRLYPRASSSAPPIWNERSDAERVADAAPRTAKGRGGERRGRER